MSRISNGLVRFPGRGFGAVMVPGLIFGTSFMGACCSIFFSKARGGVTFIPCPDFEVFYEAEQI
eukprot:XP_001706148.1 Hypothetical protein GL50803_114684 [Giardia lamblia ATCC 50803]